MKLLLALVTLAAASARAQPAIVVPHEMQPLMMLQGEWHCPNGWIDFRFQDNNTGMIVRGRADNANSKFRDVMSIFRDNGHVNADYFTATGQVIHYQLVESAAGKLVFADVPAPGQPVHRMTYRANGRGLEIFYRFEYGDQVVDSGLLTRNAVLLRPLSE